jgi:hypothetical protein
MKTLELKHITPYLPYKLKCLYSHTNKIGTISKINTIGDGFDNDNIKLSIDYLDSEHIWMFKPILRPLSDLTKEIEIEGEKFVPIDRILDNHSFVSDIHISKFRKFKIIQEQIHILKDIKELGYRYCDYWFLQYLLEWHFDVFGLIEKGLAVDINTLKP